MTWNEGLIGKALDIAQNAGRFIRVMAGPGTGKSFAMKRRIARLLHDGVNPERILAVTFTRIAAADLVREIRGLGVDGCDDIRAGTLHSICFRILNQEDVLSFSGRLPRPLVTFSKNAVLQFEAAPMLQDIEQGGKRKDTKKIQAFEAAWARRQSEAPGWPQDQADREFQQNLINWLMFHQAMLIGELVPEVLRYLNSNPNCPQLNAYDHVIVDEYQDLNRADQDLLNSLGGRSVVVIGDENQSIYRFRYAHPEGIKEYANTHPGTIDQDLDECRRCPKRVVTLANALILNNHPKSATPKLVAKEDNPEGTVHIVQWQTMEDEAEGLARYVESLLKSKDYDPSDVIILCGRRLIAYKIRDRLVARGTPVHSFFQEEALDSDSAQFAFATLTLLAYPGDRVALRFLLGCKSPSWLTAEYSRLRTYCEEEGVSPQDALDSLSAGETSLKGVKNLIARHNELNIELEALRPLKGRALLDRIAPEGGDHKHLRETVLGIVDEETLPAKMVEVVRTMVTQPEMPVDEKRVRIMSLQKSKGLTCKVAIVASCVEGIIPVSPGDEPPAEQAEILKEQRRLFYVAMTRPTEILLLSSFAQIPRALALQTGVQVTGVFGGRTRTSRFVAELGPFAPAVQRGADWVVSGYS